MSATGSILFLKKYSCYSTCLFQMFHLQQSRYLKFYMVQQSSLAKNLFTTYPQKMLPQGKSYLPQSCLQHLSKSGHIQPFKTSDFLFLSLFLVSSPPLTTTLKFPHSSLMNISPGKSNNFSIPSISIPSSSSSTVTTLFD